MTDHQQRGRLLGALLTFILLFSACGATVDGEQLAIPESPAVGAEVSAEVATPPLAEAAEATSAGSTQATESTEAQTDTNEAVDVAAQTTASTDAASTETASTEAASTDTASTDAASTETASIEAASTGTADETSGDATGETFTTTQSVVSGQECLVGTWALAGDWIPSNFALPDVTVTTSGQPILALDPDGTGSGDYNGLTMEIRDSDGSVTTMAFSGGAEFTWSADETRVTSDFSTFTLSMTGSVSVDGFTVDIGQFDITQNDLPEVLPPGTYDCFQDELRIAPGNGSVGSVDYTRITFGVTPG